MKREILETNPSKANPNKLKKPIPQTPILNPQTDL